MDSLIEGLQGFDYDADNWSIGINDTAVPYIDTQQDGQPQRKRRKLNMDKCERCRKDKKKVCILVRTFSQPRCDSQTPVRAATSR